MPTTITQPLSPFTRNVLRIATDTVTLRRYADPTLDRVHSELAADLARTLHPAEEPSDPAYCPTEEDFEAMYTNGGLKGA